MSRLHPGFKAVRNRIARRLESEGYSEKSAKSHAARILASRTRSDSAAAHRKNPRLDRVKGK